MVYYIKEKINFTILFNMVRYRGQWPFRSLWFEKNHFPCDFMFLKMLEISPKTNSIFGVLENGLFPTDMLCLKMHVESNTRIPLSVNWTIFSHLTWNVFFNLHFANMRSHWLNMWTRIVHLLNSMLCSFGKRSLSKRWLNWLDVWIRTWQNAYFPMDKVNKSKKRS